MIIQIAMHNIIYNNSNNSIFSPNFIELESVQKDCRKNENKLNFSNTH